MGRQNQVGEEAMRQVGIWASGLLATAIFGTMIGHSLAEYDGGGFFGFVAGALAFTCFRLWRTSAGQQKAMPVFDLKDGKLDRS